MTTRSQSWIPLALVLAATPALAGANYGNRGLGFSLGGMGFFGNDNLPFRGAGSLTLDGSIYLEEGWEMYANLPFVVAWATAGVVQVGGGTGPGPVVGFGGKAGVRKLFAEEALRPWVGLHTGALFILPVSGNVWSLSAPLVGLQTGLEYFVNDSIALGARAYFDVNFNVAPAFYLALAVGGALTFATYF